MALLAVCELALVRSLADRGYFAKYEVFAGRILAGEVPRDRLADLSPGYLWLVTALQAVGLGAAGIVGLQVLGLGLAALLVGDAAGRTASPLAAFVAALAVVGNRAALVNAAELEPEALILLLVALSLWLLVVGRPFAAGIVVGCWIATRPVALLPLAALTLYLAVAGAVETGGKPRWRRALAFVAGAVPLLLSLMALQYGLLGRLLFMDPGFVFYEGMNPSATACGANDPRIVKDVERTIEEPDALHVAYRIVAAQALGGVPEARAANRYWTARATAFAGAFPASALRLTAGKIGAALSSHDTYDLATQRRKSEELRQWPFVPFGVLVALGLLAVWLAGAGARIPLVLLASSGAVLPLFYVTARQRNPLLPPLALLAGLGANALLDLWRSRDRRRLVIASSLLVLAGLATGLDGDAQREDDRGWVAAESALRARARGGEAWRRGDRAAAVAALAEAETWPTGDVPEAPPDALRAAALAALPGATSVERRFELGLALLWAGDWGLAERTLATVAEYRPQRGNMVVGSVSYHRARALLHQGRHDEGCAAADAAGREAPAAAEVLELRAACHERSHTAGDAQRLRALAALLHDRYTTLLARALASWDLGDEAAARSLLVEVRDDFPRWWRPGAMLAYLDRVDHVDSPSGRPRP